MGEHNRMNALAALAAARHAGVPVAQGIAALDRFQGVKRRMEVRGTVSGITVYDDFAHHPTAFEATIAGLRPRVGKARIVAVFEPRSNTMKLGTMQGLLAAEPRRRGPRLLLRARPRLGPVARAGAARHARGDLPRHRPDGGSAGARAAARRPRAGDVQRRLRRRARKKTNATLAASAPRPRSEACSRPGSPETSGRGPNEESLYAYRILNVFAREGRLTGNPLCVFEDGRRPRRRDDAGARAPVQPFGDHVHPALGEGDGARAHLHARVRDALRGPSHARHRARRALAEGRRCGGARDEGGRHPGEREGRPLDAAGQCAALARGGVARGARGDPRAWTRPTSASARCG